MILAPTAGLLFWCSVYVFPLPHHNSDSLFVLEPVVAPPGPLSLCVQAVPTSRWRARRLGRQSERHLRLSLNSEQVWQGNFISREGKKTTRDTESIEVEEIQ